MTYHICYLFDYMHLTASVNIKRQQVERSESGAIDCTKTIFEA